MISRAPEKTNICAVVVTYLPDASLCARLMRIVPQVDCVLLVANSNSEVESRNLPELAASDPKINLIQNSSNLGVATALNQGASWAGERRYSWLLLLDQDTVVDEDIVGSLMEVYSACSLKDYIAIVGSNYHEVYSGTMPVNGSDPRPWEERATVITSGSLLSLDAYRSIGPFRDEFFIDCVDLEYCLRARAAGYHVIVTRKPLMCHSVGQTTMHHLLWKMTGTSNHPAVRRYYMVRNLTVIAKEYALKEPAWVIQSFHKRAKSLISMCLFEDTKLKKLGCAALGLVDGLFGKFNRNLSYWQNE